MMVTIFTYISSSNRLYHGWTEAFGQMGVCFWQDAATDRFCARAQVIQQHHSALIMSLNGSGFQLFVGCVDALLDVSIRHQQHGELISAE